MLIDKDCKSLRRLRWCTYILFLTIIPINLGFFLFSTNNAFSHLDAAVTDVYFNEKIRKDFLSVHDAITTLLLNNTGKFNNISEFTMDQINTLVNSEITTIQDTHNEISELTPQDEWTEVLYDYAPVVQPTQTLQYSSVNGTFSKQTMTIEIAFWKMANSLADITLYEIPDFVRTDAELGLYRWNCLGMFNDIFYRTSVEIFESITDTFNNTKSLAIWCLVTEAIVLVASLVIILALITVVTQSLKEILKSFTAIDNQSLRETETYYKRLLNFFIISQAKYVDNDSSKIPVRNSTSGMLARQNTNSNKFEKKLKRVIEHNFMKNYTRKILAYYIVATVICIVMLVVFDVEIHNTLNYADTMLTDARQVVKYNTVYISSLIGLKSLFMDRNLYASTTQHIITDTITLLETTLDKNSIKSDSSFGNLVREVYGGKICDTLKPLFSSDEQIEECRNLALGKLSMGLVLFHSYYRDLAVDALTLGDPSFGILTIDSIYEFGQLIKIIDDVLFDSMLEAFRDDMNSYMDSQQDVLLVMIIGLNVVNAIVFYWAQRGVIKSLNTKFLFYRKVYNRYMLADALMKEKRIKARLLKFQLLNK